MVGKERDTGRKLDADVDDPFDTFGVEAPNLTRLRFIGGWLADEYRAIVANDQVAAPGCSVDHCRAATPGRHHSPGTGRIEPAVTGERLSGEASRLLGNRANLSLAIDAIRFAAAGIGEGDLAAGVGGRSAGHLESVDDQLPGFAGQEDFLQLRRARSGFDRRRPIFPDPGRMASGNRTVPWSWLWPPSPQAWLTS